MRPFFSRFVIFSFLLLTGITLYMGLRLAATVGEWIFFLCLYSLVILFPLLHWRLREEEPSRARLWLQRAGFVSMGVSSWILVLTLARDVYLALVFLFAGSASAARISAQTGGWTAVILALGVTALGAVWALRGPRVREVVVPIEGLPPRLENLRVAQISDLHIGPTIGPRYVKRVMAKVRKAQPDITVLTGDIIDGSPGAILESVLLLGQLPPAGRIFFSPGNHEYYWKWPEWKPLLRGLGLRILENSGEALPAEGGTIWVGGVTDPAFAGNPPDPAAAARGGEGAALRILLSHRPEIVAGAARVGFHLQLSGHTHGGQFFPWTFVASRVHEFFLGLMKKENTWIYVSPGTGSWGPPLRVGTTPEVTLLKIVRA